MRKGGNQKEDGSDQKEGSKAAGNKSVHDGSGGQRSKADNGAEKDATTNINGSGKGKQ
jgi:hypothetical protein